MPMMPMFVTHPRWTEAYVAAQYPTVAVAAATRTQAHGRMRIARSRQGSGRQGRPSRAAAVLQQWPAHTTAAGM